MSLWKKAASISAYVLMQQPAVRRLPLLLYDQKRTKIFTHRVARLGRPRGRKPVKIEEKEMITPAALYANEIGKDVFEARQNDLPEEGMENPFKSKARQCVLCQNNVTPDYKNVKLLSQFVSSHTGRIYGRHITGLCKDQQERVETEILKARSAGFMAYYYKHPEFLADPKLCDPSRPVRPHPY